MKEKKFVEKTGKMIIFDQRQKIQNSSQNFQIQMDLRSRKNLQIYYFFDLKPVKNI